MEERAHSLDFAVRVGAEQARQAVDDAHRMYGRTLAAWVGDLLRLRQVGLVQPGWDHAGGDTILRDAA